MATARRSGLMPRPRAASVGEEDGEPAVGSYGRYAWTTSHRLSSHLRHLALPRRLLLPEPRLQSL